MLIMAPADENECRRMLQTAYEHPGPAMVRYPRGAGPGVEIDPGLDTLPLGRGEVRRTGHGVALLAFGSMLVPVLAAGDVLDASVANMRFVKPLDQEAVLNAAATHSRLVTVEENAVAGGAGSGVNELLGASGMAVPVLNLGLDDNFIQHGTREEVLHLAGLDSEGIRSSIQRFADLAPSEPPAVQAS